MLPLTWWNKVIYKA